MAKKLNSRAFQGIDLDKLTRVSANVYTFGGRKFKVWLDDGEVMVRGSKKKGETDMELLSWLQMEDGKKKKGKKELEIREESNAFLRTLSGGDIDLEEEGDDVEEF
eukprot:TRINITY_DN8838_c1_g1_i4.p1 TRINITY_DN8838_c1_g1~~TRINITY_DN8838_c1_g1_i4.p1  ORF type:complete len:106 (-),score=49.86 TRINITY_DN8838_c1_g1_i4:135-452(-)